MDREPTDQEILDILQEECAEVIHIVSKIRRFGIDNYSPDSPIPNRELLLREILDVFAMANWLRERINFPEIDFGMNFNLYKRGKVRRYCGEYTNNK